MKTIHYNEKNLNVIIEREINEKKVNKELNIPVDVFIKMENDKSLRIILMLINHFRYMMYSHIYQYIKSIEKISKTSVFERIKKLEEFNLINTYTLNNNKYATLSKRGLIYIYKDNNVYPYRQPSPENLKKAICFAEYIFRVHKKVVDIGDLKKYMELYQKVYLQMKQASNFEKKDSGIDFKRLQLDKELRHIQLRERAEYRLQNKGNIIYFSAKEYLEEEYSYLKIYLQKSKTEQRTTERDELSTMQNQYVYYIKMNENNVLELIMFDFGRSKNFYRETLLHIDKIVRRMHQYITEKHFTWEITIHADNEQRQKELNQWVDQIKKEFKKYEKRAYELSTVVDFIDRERLAYQQIRQRKATFYMESIKVELLDISRFFRSTVKDKELPIIESEEIDIIKL